MPRHPSRRDHLQPARFVRSGRCDPARLLARALAGTVSSLGSPSRTWPWAVVVLAAVTAEDRDEPLELVRCCSRLHGDGQSQCVVASCRCGFRGCRERAAPWQGLARVDGTRVYERPGAWLADSLATPLRRHARPEPGNQPSSQPARRRQSIPAIAHGAPLRFQTHSGRFRQ